MTFSDKLQKQQEREEAEIAAWELGEYVSDPCPNCNRHRLCTCENGKHRCDKCNWVPEDNGYCPLAL